MQISNLTIQYDTTVIDDVNLQFKKGEVTVIKGVSGSGKSSILNVLGLLMSNSAQYKIDDINIEELSKEEKSQYRLKNIGFVFQQNNLLPSFTAVENVQMPMLMDGNSNKEKAEELIEFVGLSDVMNKRTNVLSGGQEQRVAIARAVANDAMIILADEPTAALDDINKSKILDLFTKLAHDNNKIVIIASHDDAVTEIADKIYEIKEKKVECVKESGKSEEIQSHTKEKIEKSTDKKLFYRFYNKNKKSDIGLNRGLIIITTFIAIIAMLFCNFGDNFSAKQVNFINAISDKSLFLVNDILGIKAKTDYAEALALSEQEIDKVKQVPHIMNVYPYFYFTSLGMEEKGETNEDIGIVIRNEDGSVLKGLNYPNQQSNESKDTFAVTPFYPEENIEYMALTDNNNFSSGAVLTNSLLKKIDCDANQLIGKDIEITCYVPTKLYTTNINMMNHSNNQKTVNQIETNLCYYKKVIISEKISGVLTDDYTTLRTEGTTDCIMLNYDKMNQILLANLSTDIDAGKEKFAEKPYSPSALSIFADDYSNVSDIKDRLERISPVFCVNCAAIDVVTIQENISTIKTIMSFVTGLIVLISIIMFSTLYYLKNRTRKKEIGILRAMGLTQGNVRHLFLREMYSITTKSFLASVILSLVSSFILNAILSQQLFTITVSSVILGFVLSCIIVLISGVVPVIKVSKIDPVRAIHEDIKS